MLIEMYWRTLTWYSLRENLKCFTSQSMHDPTQYFSLSIALTPTNLMDKKIDTPIQSVFNLLKKKTNYNQADKSDASLKFL